MLKYGNALPSLIKKFGEIGWKAIGEDDAIDKEIQEK